MFFGNPHGKQKGNTYRRYAEENENDPEHITTKKNQQNRRQQERERDKITRQTKINLKITIVSPSISIITSNVNGLYSIIKRHIVAE